MTLNSEYQYIGRTNGVKASGRDYYFYILLYAKTTGAEDTGKHTVSVKMRLACTASSSFYGYLTKGKVTVDGQEALGWTASLIPAEAWGGYNLTEGGVYYARYTDLGEGTAEVNTGYEEKSISITANWQRLAVGSTTPDWLPSMTEAKYAADITLPEIKRPDEPEPEPEPEPDPEPEEPTTGTPSPVVVYADDQLVYDSLLEEYDLAGLRITTGLNVGGTAEITMERNHPAYNAFTNYRTIVTIYRDGVLRFRGRALYTAETFFGERTVTCEGEMCLLRDSINRPYKYEATPRSCFVTLLNAHNAAVEPEKRFKVGEVTVTDANDYIKLESESAETTLDTLNKLVDRCGGYITFTGTGKSRTINWLAELDNRSGQAIEFGENLLDFASTGANTTDLATALVPYGAKDEATKQRITIASVNGGKDWIQDDMAVALRGTIMATAVWDDVTEPANLLKKARAWLNEHKTFITSLELTALDLSYLDKSIDSFTVGDTIRVVSVPHGIDEDFMLSKMTEDLLRPANSTITMGKDIQSLTGADVAGYTRSQNEIEAVKVNYNTDIGNVTSQVEATVLAKVGGTYATTEALSTEVSARAGVINKVDGTVHISGGAPINMLGGKIDIDGSEINFGKEARFLNNSGIRIADKDGNSYYVLRVDNANSCVVGNDYTNLYLRGKDAVYLYKTGAAVTSDRRQKNSAEPLPGAYMAMLDKLTPMRYRYNGRGDRYHVGFIAQDVEQALAEAGLSREDFGGFVDLNGDGSELGLAYDEFIGLLLQKIRQLETRINAMEAKA